ncbi:MAG: dihydrolipoamide acetyltransferase family protein [Ekhidna sp.]
MIEFSMPSLGADMEAGTLTAWRVKPGEFVKKGDIIADVETQKGIIEIEVFDEGTIEKLLIKEDEKVPVGTIMALISADHEVPAPPKSKQLPEEKSKEASPVVEPARIRISPLARRMAEQNNIDFSIIEGTGERGFIVKEDIEKVISGKGKRMPKATVDKVSTATEGIRSAIASAMSRSNREIPHYYLSEKIDMSNALNWLLDTNKQLPVKQRLLPAAILIKAVANSLVIVPELNAIWDNGLQMKRDIHPGFVVSLRNGGVVIPSVHHADKKSPQEIMKVLADVISRARSMRLKSSELSDSTVTITSLGERGVEIVQGVIYPPQVALIGFGGIREEPIVENKMLGIRPVITATLAADHRATDGHVGDRFLKILKENLQKPEQL